MRSFRLRPTGGWFELLSGVLAIIAGGLAIADGLPEYGDRRPQLGPGAYPTWVGLGLVILGVILLVRTWRRAPEEAPVTPTPSSRREILITLVALAAYVVALPRLGFLLSTGAFLLVHLLMVGRYSWLRSILYAAVLTVAITWIFMDALPIGLPVGILGI